MTVTLTMPMPPSLNNAFVNIKRGRRKSKAHEAWANEAAWKIRAQRPIPVAGRVILEWVFGWKDVSKLSDLSNRLKLAEDALVAAGVIDDDRFIESFQARKDYQSTDVRVSIFKFIEGGGMSETLQQEVIRLRERNEVLEYELTSLRESADVVATALQQRFRLTPTESKILAALSDGKPRTKGWLEDSFSQKEDVSVSWIGVYIYKLRRRIAPLKIINHWGHSFQIMGDDLAAIQSIIKGNSDVAISH